MSSLPYFRPPPLCFVITPGEINEAGVVCTDCSNEAGEEVRHPVIPAFYTTGDDYLAMICPRWPNREVGLIVA